MFTVYNQPLYSWLVAFLLGGSYSRNVAVDSWLHTPYQLALVTNRALLIEGLDTRFNNRLNQLVAHTTGRQCDTPAETNHPLGVCR